MKRTFTREEAIDILTSLYLDSDEDELKISSKHIKNMSNEDLEAELCLSGYIHDGDMGGVI